MFACLTTLAQQAATAQPDAANASAGSTEVAASPAALPLWQVLLNNSFALTILFIFLTAIVAIVVKQWQKDKCLKLLHGYHVGYITTAGRVLWGDLIVYSKGLELVFDAPYRTRRGIVKTSALIFAKDMGQTLAICRSVDALSAHEKKLREQQIRRSYNPGPVRRSLRWTRNILNTLRDAFSKAMGTIIGQLTRKAPGALASQQSDVNQIGQTLLGAAGNAYEPILERHIGRPVVLRLNNPAAENLPAIDLPGYLVDYTDQYVAVFNTHHEPIEQEKLQIDLGEQTPIKKTGYLIERAAATIRVQCTGPDVVIVRWIKTDKRYSELETPIVCGTSLELNTDGAASIELGLQRTRRVDIVCPREHASIDFGGNSMPDDPLIEKSHGLAPEPQVEEQSDDPADAQESATPSA